MSLGSREHLKLHPLINSLRMPPRRKVIPRAATLRCACECAHSRDGAAPTHSSTRHRQSAWIFEAFAKVCEARVLFSAVRRWSDDSAEAPQVRYHSLSLSHSATEALALAVRAFAHITTGARPLSAAVLWCHAANRKRRSSGAEFISPSTHPAPCVLNPGRDTLFWEPAVFF
jgi:hypothetical protein